MELLIVEDDEKVRIALERGLREAGYVVVAVPTAEAAVRRLSEERPRLAILDIGLPGADGFSVLSYLRKHYAGTPAIILTARDSVQDRVAGLEAGADDYLVKPFAFAELLARVRARLRKESESGAITIGNLCIDSLKGFASCEGRKLDLTPLEFKLLLCLAHNRGSVVTREMLASEVWHIRSRATPIDNIIQVHVSHLRSKLEDCDSTELVRTVRGLGYVLGDSQ